MAAAALHPRVASAVPSAEMRSRPARTAYRQATSGARAAAAAALGVTRRPGTPLPHALSDYFAPRFGADLSDVRLHTDARAGIAAEAIDADAFTRGRHIGFAPAAYRPDTAKGRHLIAHELAHAVRHGETPAHPAVIHRQFRRRRFAERGGGGTTDFEEIVEEEPTRVGDLVQGTVTRREIAPARDGKAEEVIHEGEAFVSFDAARCEVILPFRFGFRQRATDPDGDSCEEPPPAEDVPLLPRERIDRIATAYVDAVNRGLNQRFTVRVSGCENECAERDMAIRVRASRDDIDFDRMITIVPRGGRGDAGTLCARNFDQGFAVHEAGHQILGMGDQYREDDEGVRRRVPEWARDERVRTDYPVMGARRSYGRFAIFHERDFRHVQVFLEAAFPGCTVTLSPVPNVVLDYRVLAQFGFGTLGGAPALRVGGGFDIGVPLQRDRAWSLLVGAHASYLAQLSAPHRELVLAGIRLGLERRFTRGWGGGQLFLGAEGGVSRELGSRSFAGGEPITHGPRTTPYAGAEIGGGVSFGSIPSTAVNFRLGVGGELGRKEAMRWVTAGLDIVWRF